MRSAVRDAFVGFTTPLEGKVAWAYPDTKNLVSTGIGNLIDPMPLAMGLPWMKADGTRASAHEIEAEWHRIKTLPSAPDGRTSAQLGHLYAKKFATLHLTDAGISDLVMGKLAQMNAYLVTHVFDDFEDWCCDAQLGTLSMSWACGPAFNRTWPKLTAALRARDYLTACVESFMPEEVHISGLRPRNVANRKLFSNASVVERRKFRADVLYYPADLVKDIVDPGGDPST